MSVPPASPPSAPTPAFWTDGRRELRDWLGRNAASLGELYEAALLLLYGLHMPGWPRLVGHAVREIANRLPGVLGGPRKAGQLQYKNRMDDIASGWRKAG